MLINIEVKSKDGHITRQWLGKPHRFATPACAASWACKAFNNGTVVTLKGSRKHLACIRVLSDEEWCSAVVASRHVSMPPGPVDADCGGAGDLGGEL